MPFIECHVATGLSQPQKNEADSGYRKGPHQSIGSDPKIINVILVEHPEANMSISGRIYGEASK